MFSCTTSNRVSRIRMPTSSASTGPSATKCPMLTCSNRCARCARLRAIGSTITTRSDHTTVWGEYRRRCSVGEPKPPETLLLNCLIDGGAYGPTGNDPPDILHSLDQERTLLSFVKMLDLREAIARTALDHVTHIGRVCRIGEDYILDVLGVH